VFAYHTGNLFSLTSSNPQSYVQQCQASSVTVFSSGLWI